MANKTKSSSGDKNKLVAAKGDSVEDKLAALSAYRMAQGLCRKCGEKCHKGYKCADSVQLNALQEVWDFIEPDAQHNQQVE
jgi:hypothetical protein